MNAREVADRLAQRAEELARFLLPAGKLVNGEWTTGNAQGEPGRSLKVRVTGSKAGVWSDFAAGSGGTLIDLWMTVRGVPFVEALRECQQWLGLPDESLSLPDRRPRQKPDLTKSTWRPLTQGGAVERYLTQQRQISPAVLARYQVGENDRGTAAGFVFRYCDGSVACHKFIALERPSGKKQVWVTPGGGKVLWGKDAIADSDREIIITEGEIDALTLATLGFASVSVPFGAKADGDKGNEEWIEADWEWLNRFLTIRICMDADDPGKRAADAIIARLGAERCRKVAMPDGFKDPNEALCEGCGADLVDSVNNAQSCDPIQLKNAEEFRDATWLALHPSESDLGIPFHGIEDFRIRPGELTVWTGFSGHNKSGLLLQTLLEAAYFGQRCCIASLEIPPEKTLRSMSLNAAGGEIKDEDNAEQKVVFKVTFDWLTRWVWIYDKVGTANWQEMIRVFRYANRRYGILHFAVDSLLKCGIAFDDYEGQKAITTALVDFARESKSHVHLVVHSRKRENESHPPDKLDVKGAGDITDLAFNGLTVWRNKGKERDLAAMDEMPVHERMHKTEKLEKEPDIQVMVWKQRETGSEPMIDLWFHKPTRQCVRRGKTPKFYVKIEDLKNINHG